MMAFGRTNTVALWGIEAVPISVECRIHSGLPAFNLVGLPDTSVAESRERVRAAIQACGLTWPMQRITVALTPADQPKSGAGLDLAIATAICKAAGIPLTHRSEHVMYLGELGLDGHLHPVRGVLPAVVRARNEGFTKVVIPLANVVEAQVIPNIEVQGIAHFSQILAEPDQYGSHDCLELGCAETSKRLTVAGQEVTLDMADVIGQAAARQALEIAAAGGHHVFLNGPPGVGKTMLAERIPSIMPDLTESEALEVMSVQSICGTLRDDGELVRRPPFENPHHTATRAALVGGGSGIARPGAISRAHRGVLFLDEAPEFSPSVLDCLRQPLERGHITLHRSRGKAIFPSQFMLVMAANPCPCGYAADKPQKCQCTGAQQHRYMQRISGPLLDRIDIRSHVSQPRLRSVAGGEPSSVMRGRVVQARYIQLQRYRGQSWQLNSQAPGRWLRQLTQSAAPQLLNELMYAVDRGMLSLRGLDRTLRLIWTHSDIHGREYPIDDDLSAAMILRGGLASYES